MRVFIKSILCLLLSAGVACAQSVQQSGNVTPNLLSGWVTNGVIGSAGTASDSPISSFGVTNNSGPGICVSTGRSTATGRQQLCLAATLNGGGQITLQNYGTATAQPLQFVINGSTISLPTGGGTTIPTITTPLLSGNIICASGTSGALVGCAAGTSGQLFLATTSAAPGWATMSGDATILPSGALTVTHVNGVTYGTSPSTNTVPVVTSSNTVTYEALPLAAMATIGNNTALGNVSGGTAVPVALTATQLTTLCNSFTSSLSGCAPLSGGGTANLLRADGSWTAAVTGGFTVAPASGFIFLSQGNIKSPADGVFELLNNAGTGFTRLQLGGTTSSFPSIKRNSTAINLRLADDSADAPLTAGATTITGSFTATGLVTNADLVSPTVTVNTVACTLGSSCSISAAASLIVGSSTITSGVSGGLLYETAGHLLGNSAAVSSPTLIINQNTSATPSYYTTFAGLVFAPANDSNNGITVASYGAGSANLILSHTAGTGGSPTAVSSGAGLSTILTAGYDGTNYILGANLGCNAAQTWSPGANGTNCILQVTQNGSASLTTAWTVGQDLSFTSAGRVTATAFTAGASAGLSTTKTVRASGGGSDCSLIYTGGLLTGGSC